MRRLALILLFVMLGCGKDQPPPPVPAPPTPGTPPPTGPGAPTLGLNLADPLPGTPLTQTQSQEALRALVQNLGAHGQATIQTQTAVDYVVQGYYPQVQWTPVGQPQPEPFQIPTYGIGPAHGGGNLVLQFSNRYEGTYRFAFTYRVRGSGLDLRSTDAVALFEGYTREGYTILKVPYRAPNPAIYSYTLSGSGFGGPRYRVLQRVYATHFVYPPQQGQTPYQPNPNPYDYGY